MTDDIRALLEELKEADFETWKDIKFLLSNFMIWPEPRNIPLEKNAYSDIIQGSIQRAIVARGWEYVVSYDREARQSYGQIGIPISNIRLEYLHRNYASPPAAAILAAYVAAKRAMQ